ncbi:MAG TPA: hypothetical protein VJ553_00255 [Candidatus Paceibacterota bacterium]|nr:hypothetical protein [Candidatus Paceibacterota bacterium]
MKRITLSVLVVVVLLVGAYVLWPSIQQQQPETSTPTASPVVGESRTFSSGVLGISFQYIPLHPESVTVAVKEVGDRIYVYDTRTGYEGGQFVEQFSKKTNETFEASIRRQILAGFTGQCTVELARSNIYSGGWIAEIGYPDPSDPNDPPWENAQYCNEDYAQTNGIRYFLYDEDFPDRFYYFDIGQYSIFGRDEIPWQHTIELF